MQHRSGAFNLDVVLIVEVLSVGRERADARPGREVVHLAFDGSRIMAPAAHPVGRARRRPVADRGAHRLAARRLLQAQVANEPRFAPVTPAGIVPMLANEGTYLACESSFRRVLRENGQSRHRGRAKAPQASRPPTTLVARAPGEVWCWDMTFLPAETKGRWFFLYLILYLFSRKVVGWEVHDTDEADHAARLVRRAALAEGVDAMASRPVLHGDNGATLKATTVLAMLHWLGIKPSYSRSRVWDDSPFVEALFKTAKYRPEHPAHGFAGLHEAHAWAKRFGGWYNDEHRHDGIRYVTPAQRHACLDREFFAARHDLYQAAKELNPAR